MMADVPHHSVGLSTSAEFVGGPQKGSIPNERAGAAAQRPGKRGSIYANVKPIVPKSTAKNAIMSLCHGFSFRKIAGLAPFTDLV